MQSDGSSGALSGNRRLLYDHLRVWLGWSPSLGRTEITVQEIMTWVILRRAMQNAGDVARREVFDRVEGRPTLKIAGPTGGPIETVTYDLKKLSAEKVKTIRAILAEAVDPPTVP